MMIYYLIIELGAIRRAPIPPTASPGFKRSEVAAAKWAPRDQRKPIMTTSSSRGISRTGHLSLAEYIKVRECPRSSCISAAAASLASFINVDSIQRGASRDDSREGCLADAFA